MDIDEGQDEAREVPGKKIKTVSQASDLARQIIGIVLGNQVLTRAMRQEPFRVADDESEVVLLRVRERVRYDENGTSERKARHSEYHIKSCSQRTSNTFATSLAMIYSRLAPSRGLLPPFSTNSSSEAV